MEMGTGYKSRRRPRLAHQVLRSMACCHQMYLACLVPPLQDSHSELPEGALARARVCHGPSVGVHDWEEPPTPHLRAATHQPCTVSMHTDANFKCCKSIGVQ